MKKLFWWLRLDPTAKDIPLWMYYILNILLILEGFLSLFSLLCHKRFGFSIDWATYMLRQMAKNTKRRRNI